MDLTALLTAGARFDAEFGGGLSNHRPMALLALARLGAPAGRVEAFAQGYARRLHSAPPPAPWPHGEPWDSRLGQRHAWPNYRDWFARRLRNEGRDAVLRQALPRLMQGCGAAAFHGLIRTAYAVDMAHQVPEQELADALAYWACRWLDLGAATVTGRESDPGTVLSRLRAAPSDAGLIFLRMRVAAQQPHFKPTVAQLRVGARTLPQLAALAARAYAASGNFTALHLVTSAHALRVLLPQLAAPLVAVQAYWRAYAAAVCAAGLRPGTPPAPRPWPVLVAAALASDDEHLIKLVDSCRQEEQAHDHNRVWQQAATRAVQDAAPSSTG